MRRRVRLRRMTLRRAALAVPVIAAPVLGAGLAQAAGGSTGQGIVMTVKQHRIAYGHDVTVTGHAPSGDQGRWVDLDFARAGSSSWQKIASAKIQGDDHFALHGQLRRSGRVKVVAGWAPAPAPSTTTSSGGGVPPTSGSSASSTAPASQPEAVRVTAALHVKRRTIDDMGDHQITISGKLQPVSRGLVVRLQARSGGGWHKVSQDLTGRSGRFYLHYRPGSGEPPLRVHFVGNRFNAPVRASAGKVVVFTQSVASWYEDGGNTACGYHVTYGVANRTLPCGTKVTFSYHGRTVTATVDDRGPYVSGREWDLNQNTASALGFGGVDDVWASR
jgi:rare lipoprotein A